ncbi:hypothetical protein ACJJH9_15380 [Microbulbifer sp. DLAB2-AF]|uniref:hypothetical protein n=1 Tax=Microbulbifer sp. DLAB2-AF TaxID=3243395 RepID=UPI00403A52D8
MKPLKGAGLIAAIAIAISNQSVNATELSGACYDYATREATSTVGYDGAGVGLVMAGMLMEEVLDASPLSALSAVFPFAFKAAEGRTFQERPGADPEIVGCLEQLNSRLQSLELNVTTDAQQTLESIFEDAKTEIAIFKRYEKHVELAEKLKALSITWSGYLENELNKVDIGATTPESYRELINELVPTYVSLIQLELLHRQEYNRYCYNREEYPTWNNIEPTEMISQDILYSIEMLQEDVEDYLNIPDGDESDCRAGFDTYQVYDKIITANESTDHNALLSKVGIKISEGAVPGMASATLDFTNTKLNDYRRSLVTACSNGLFRDEWLNDFRNYSNDSVCNENRDIYLDSLNNISLFSSEAERNMIFRDLVHVADQWDRYNFDMPEAKFQIAEDSFEFFNAYAVKSFAGVRLRHMPTDTCVNLDGKVDKYCDIEANHFILLPYGDGYKITRLSDNRNFKDKGEDAEGFVIRSGLGADSVWELFSEPPSWFNPYFEFKNANTGRCLIVNEAGSLAAGNCEDGSIWEVDGVNIPDEEAFVRIRHAEADVCFGTSGVVGCDDNAFLYELAKYNDGYRITRNGRNLKDKEDGIRFVSGLGDVATWYMMDLDTNGIFRLQNKYTEKCLDYNSDSSSLVAVNCGLVPSETEFFALETVDLPSKADGELIGIHPSGITGGENLCLSRYRDDLSGEVDAFRVGSCAYGSIAVTKHEGGYLIWDRIADSYIQDLNQGFGHNSLGLSNNIESSTTWDFIGPYTLSDGGSYFQIKNRSTGTCLIPQTNPSRTDTMLLGKVECGDDASKVWSYTTN